MLLSKVTCKYYLRKECLESKDNLLWWKLLFPIRYLTRSEIEDDKRFYFYSLIEEYSKLYAVNIGPISS